MLDEFTGAELQQYGEAVARWLARASDAAIEIFNSLPDDSGDEYQELWRKGADLVLLVRELKDAHDDVTEERRARRAGTKAGEHYAGQFELEAALAARGR